MARNGGASRGGTSPQVEARCAWCGQVELGDCALEVHLGSGSQALAEFACPQCEQVNLVRLEARDAETLIAAGVQESEGLAPFELLEGRSGPPIGWDDLIDFHQELEGSDVLPLVPRPGSNEDSSATYERDAA